MLLLFVSHLNILQRELMSLWSCLKILRPESGGSLSKRPVLRWDSACHCGCGNWFTLHCVWLHCKGSQFLLFYWCVFHWNQSFFRAGKVIVFIRVSLWLADNIGLLTYDYHDKCFWDEYRNKYKKWSRNIVCSSHLTLPKHISTTSRWTSFIKSWIEMLQLKCSVLQHRPYGNRRTATSWPTVFYLGGKSTFGFSWWTPRG